MLDKHFEPQKIEQKHYRKSEESGVFACNVDADNAPFTIMMPPPNVTGSLHMGHALTMTIQDVLTRYHRMNGKDALWQPGTDHAGIATQMVVERLLDKEGLSRHDLGREKFEERVWQWKEESGGTIVNQLKCLGASPDWNRERFTMDEGLSNAVRKVFVQLYEEGLIYRDKRLVNWDPKLQTAVSDIEVEHKDVKGNMYHFHYPFEDGSGSVVVATTRPETILADGAVAVHPDDERYQHLIGKNVVVPVVDRIIPIIADEYVKSDFGSGCVKITAAHDFNDFEVYKRHKDKGIPLINLMTPDGYMNENCPEGYVGLTREEARKKVVRDFEDLDYLEKIEPHQHQVPYGDRSGVVIEPFLTEQWYCNAEVLAKPAIEAVESGKVEFVPKNWENTFYEWMRNIQPWCISRQLWWGHQIPAWYGPQDEVYVAENEEQAKAKAREKYGEDVELRRDNDVLDTWFSSALWPFSTLGWPYENAKPMLDKYYPGDVLVTGFDIIFFWVARMMMMGIHFMGDVPFHKVYMHALVRDAKGQKMSKSKGNVMDPLDLIEKYGTDALRFTLMAMAAQGRDIKLAEDRIEGYRNFATKLWNATRYAEMNGCTYNQDFDPKSVQHTLNKWIISEVASAKNNVDRAMNEYRFNDAANTLYQFTWGTFCDWYLEFTKPLLQGDSTDKTEIQQTAGWVIKQILVMLNPFMPFITEELNEQYIGNTDTQIMAGDWPQFDDTLIDTKASSRIEWLIDTISEIRSVRADMNVPAGAKIDLQVKDASPDIKDGFDSYNEVICRMARLNSISFVDGVPKGAVQTIVGQTTLILPIAELIDLRAESERLQKTIKKLEKDIEQINKKLSNEQFVAKAPDEVVEEQKHRREEAEKTCAKFKAALQQLEQAA